MTEKDETIRREQQLVQAKDGELAEAQQQRRQQEVRCCVCVCACVHACVCVYVCRWVCEEVG